MKGAGITKTRKYKFDKHAFDFFIKNSTRTYFNVADSRYGIISHMILNPGIISPYISTDIDSFGEYIDSLLIKIVFISSEDNNIPIIEKKTMKKFNFKNEVHIQEKIYNATNKNLQPVCPAIVYSKIITDDDSIKNMLSQILDITEDLPKLFDGIGIIAMEFAKGYTSMDNSSTPENFVIPEYIAAFFIILFTAWKTGYSHGDFHVNNILMKHTNPNNLYFDVSTLNNKSWQYRNFKNIRPMLIDFGYAKKLTTSQNTLLERYIDENKYTEAASLITLVGRNTDEPTQNTILSFPSFYGWFSGALSFSEHADEFMDTDSKYSMTISEYTRRRNQKLLKYHDNSFDLNSTIELLFQTKELAEINTEPIVRRIRAALKIQNIFVKTRRLSIK